MESAKIEEDSRQTGLKSKYVPAHGRDVEVALAAVNEFETSRTRDNIAYILLFAIGAAMLVATLYGFYRGSFGGLKDVWTVAGPITGGIVGYYFHRGRKDGAE
ncbi:MAG: hypothetical protein M0Z28_05990 [Rhodospirillales bacterium]|nr:hypothetical protein [Rhodospirillales bacterium]